MEDLGQQKLFLYAKALKRIEELEAETESLKRRLASAEGRVRAAASSEASEPREDEDFLDEVIRDLQRLRRKLKRAPWQDTDDPACDAFASMLAQNIAQARNSARKMRKYWPPEDDGTRCPSCDSPSPHLHPAIQHEGEVRLCSDAFHARDAEHGKQNEPCKRMKVHWDEQQGIDAGDVCERCGREYRDHA